MPHGHPRELVETVLDGVRAVAPADWTVTHARGADIEVLVPDTSGPYWPDGQPKPPVFSPAPVDEAQLREAVATARAADYAVVVVGDTIALTGEGRSTATLDLHGGQIALLDAIAATGTPMIVVLVQSKPSSLPDSALNAAALVEAFNPGMRGGRAIAELLLGLTEPSGRLPISFARHVGQQPVYYNQVRGQHGTRYADLTQDPLFAFGEGLSYTTVTYSALALRDQDVPVDGTIHATVRLTNTGALAADVTVVVVGEPPAMSGEASSRSDITLPGAQEGLITAIADTGKPFVVVLVNGRPLTIGGWLDSAPAVMEAWHPGMEAGNAVADVLFGTVNPGGKLPVTFPRTVGQVPIYYNHENTGRPYHADNKYTSKYLDLPDGPQFPFGHGLNYTTFTISDPALSTRRISSRALHKGDTVEVTVTARNTGERAGDEVVQLYLHDPVASIVQPVRRLRGFRRVSLAPGKSTIVRFRLDAGDLGFWTHDTSGQFELEAGDIDIYVGSSSLTTARTTLTID
jgi:hypothetical protein